jgi:hypothetical protein
MGQPNQGFAGGIWVCPRRGKNDSSGTSNIVPVRIIELNICKNLDVWDTTHLSK